MRGDADGQPASTTSDESITGIELGGGGSRGSFELGALAYLYRTQPMAPSVIAGCSIGAVIASALATTAQASEQAAEVAVLDRLVCGFSDHRGMFDEEPWLREVSAHLPAASSALRQLRRRTSSAGPALTGLPLELPLPSGEASEPPDNGEVDRGVSEIWGALRTLARSARELEPSVRQAFRARSLYTLGPLRALLDDPELFGLEDVPRSGVTLRLPVVSLESGTLRYVTENGGFVDRHNQPLPELGQVSLIDAVSASSAVPGVFPAVRLGDEHYVDGGVREILPLPILTQDMGVRRSVAILAQAPGLHPRPELHGTAILPVVARALGEIALEEIRRRDLLMATETPGVTVIEPELDVHGAFEVHPG